MRLFEILNSKLTISEEAYLLNPFKKLWDRDKTKDKERALAELGYVYYIEDFKSDFSDIIDESDRVMEVRGSLDLPKGWKEDVLVKEAREFYRKRSEEILPLLLLRDAKTIIDKMRTFYREVDFLATDKNGKATYDIDRVSRVIERSGNILETLNKLEDQVKRDLQSKKDKVGQKSKTIFEDGIE
jgi:hypothetical protein